ncbi:MAG: hypothetical protein AB3N23_22210 [Paracoccaceae bacterium]
MIVDVWNSFRRLPVWVQIWVVLVLVPMNLVPLAFLGAPMGGWVAALSVGGMALNLPIMVAVRGFSRSMALPHLVLWTPLVVLVIWLLASGTATGGYATMLILLLIIDLISLAFDINDARLWVKGDRDAH